MSKEKNKCHKYNVDNLIKKVYVSSFGSENRDIEYLILICTKVISNNIKTREISINIDRLYDEFIYFKYYSERRKIYLLNFFLPLILVNRSFENYSHIAVDLVDKITKFYGYESEKYRYLVDLFCYDFIFRKLLSKEELDVESLFMNIKESIIIFNPYTNNRKDNVKFQVEKIKYINSIHKLINDYEKGMDLKTNIVIFDIFLRLYLKSIDDGSYIFEELSSDGLNNLKQNSDIYTDDAKKNNFQKGYIHKEDLGIISIENTLKELMQIRENAISETRQAENEDVRKTRINFIKAMSDYIIKIRNFEIQTKSYNGKTTPRKFLNLNVGDKISDPIFSNAEVISKLIVDNCCIVDLKTKTGKYKLTFKGRNKDIE